MTIARCCFAVLPVSPVAFSAPSDKASLREASQAICLNASSEATIDVAQGIRKNASESHHALAYGSVNFSERVQAVVLSEERQT